MQDGKLRICYGGELKPEVDAWLRACLKMLGYECWASGYNLKTRERALLFETVQRSPEPDHVATLAGDNLE